MPISSAVADLLEATYERFNQPNFIPHDPICIPHRFTKPQDIEIAAFFAATLAWGQRKTIISKCTELMQRMDNAPHDFILHHTEADLSAFLNFKHRTFNATDTLYFIDFLQRHYRQSDSLETAFLHGHSAESDDTYAALAGFHQYFFDDEMAPIRTRKHVATPVRKSSCKRLNMFLRWMVRTDDRGVDFGLWSQIKPQQLVCPCDVHVDRVARHLGLISRPSTDWLTAIELTHALRTLDANDPVKYDFAIFGLGIEHYF